MAEESRSGEQGGRPRHTPEEEEAFNERIQLLEQYHDLAVDNVDPRVNDRFDEAYASGDERERQHVRYLTWHSWYLIPILLAIAILVVVSIFYFGSGEDLTASLESGAEGSVVNEYPVAAQDPAGIDQWVADYLEGTSAATTPDPARVPSSDAPAAAPGVTMQTSTEAPTGQAPVDAIGHFAGVITSDNGWFRIVVGEDGSVSGTLSVSMEVPGGSVKQTGSYSGTIDEDNLIACTGEFEGVSVDGSGVEYPHRGTVTLTAHPAESGLPAWEIEADGDPGDAIVLPAHSQ